VSPALDSSRVRRHAGAERPGRAPWCGELRRRARGSSTGRRRAQECDRRTSRGQPECGGHVVRVTAGSRRGHSPRPGSARRQVRNNPGQIREPYELEPGRQREIEDEVRTTVRDLRQSSWDRSSGLDTAQQSETIACKLGDPAILTSVERPIPAVLPYHRPLAGTRDHGQRTRHCLPPPWPAPYEILGHRVDMHSERPLADREINNAATSRATWATSASGGASAATRGRISSMN
jgi:hypothetical protein